MAKHFEITIRVTDEVEDIPGLMETIPEDAEAIIRVDGYALGGYIQSWKVA